MWLALGDFLFRWRSYLPLILVPPIVLAIATSAHPMPSYPGRLAWEMACLLIACAGLALRVWTVGVAARGTSGRNTRQQKASTLNTTGPYSVMRHPLYVGNGLIVFGLALFPGTVVAALLVALVTIAYYAIITAREEAFLRERFGPAFATWAARVPALVPNVSRYVPSAIPFDWRIPLRREFYALALILIMPFALDVVAHLTRHGVLQCNPVWGGLAGAGAIGFVVLRALKKRTPGGDSPSLRQA
ncbi:MAG TPA: isoprenylcysteine carboxylmethyltransferase family protein [Methylomirabilota bacterium]